MFGHAPFYHSLIRKYVAYFGTVFNDMHITRTLSNGTSASDFIKVPISYAPKKKVLIRFEQDPDIERPAAIVLPRMSFEIGGSMMYDGARNLPDLNQHVTINATNSNNMKTLFTPTPVNIPFNLYIYAKNTEDANKIIEQIMPFFKPAWTATLHLIPEMNIVQDVPLILDDIQFEDQYEGSFKQRQVLIWTISFTMKGFLYGPIRDKPIIKFAKTRYFVDSNENEVVNVVTVTPGLTDEGGPTSNSELTILPGEIYVDDDFGYIVTVTNTEEE